MLTCIHGAPYYRLMGYTHKAMALLCLNCVLRVRPEYTCMYVGCIVRNMLFCGAVRVHHNHQHVDDIRLVEFELNAHVYSYAQIQYC